MNELTQCANFLKVWFFWGTKPKTPWKATQKSFLCVVPVPIVPVLWFPDEPRSQGTMPSLVPQASAVCCWQYHNCIWAKKRLCSFNLQKERQRSTQRCLRVFHNSAPILWQRGQLYCVNRTRSVCCTGVYCHSKSQGLFTLESFLIPVSIFC